jgi:hypothetical protein
VSRLRHRRAPLVGSVRLHRLASGPKAGLGEPVGPPVLTRTKQTGRWQISSGLQVAIWTCLMCRSMPALSIAAPQKQRAARSAQQIINPLGIGTARSYSASWVWRSSV